MKSYYKKRLAESQAALDEMIERSHSADGEEFERFVEEVTAAQREVNNWKGALEGLNATGA